MDLYGKHISTSPEEECVAEIEQINSFQDILIIK
jgi:hypothetical protein